MNPTGLDAPGQVTSAFDLAIFSRAGLTDRDFRRYVSTVSVAFPAQEPKGDARRKSYMIYNQNPLLLSGYPGVLGVKTGYTTEAGRTFVGAAERGGRTLIVALMGVVESSETAATKLLNWGFGRGQDALAVGSLEEPLVTITTPQVVPDTDSTPQAAAVEDATASEPVRSGGAAVAVWVVVGLGLTVSGWWLQRRRPSAPR
jgi:D-alanyl-D-alanine carboxypeptidase (penicillin-binding protein 5/6)